MNIVYSTHSKKRMKERGIEEWEIEHTLKFPSYIKKSFGERRVAVANIKNREIKVIFSKKENYIKIITVI